MLQKFFTILFSGLISRRVPRELYTLPWCQSVHFFDPVSLECAAITLVKFGSGFVGDWGREDIHSSNTILLSQWISGIARYYLKLELKVRYNLNMSILTIETSFSFASVNKNEAIKSQFMRTINIFIFNIQSHQLQYILGSTGSFSLAQGSSAGFHNGFPLIVFRSPMIIKAKRARVHIKFNLLGSSRNPTSPSTLHRTLENIIISLSRPWKESIVEKVTGDFRVLVVVKRWRSTWICFVYGERTVISRSDNLFSGGASMFCDKRGSKTSTTFTWPSLLLEREPYPLLHRTEGRLLGWLDWPSKSRQR